VLFLRSRRNVTADGEKVEILCTHNILLPPSRDHDQELGDLKLHSGLSSPLTQSFQSHTHTDARGNDARCRFCEIMLYMYGIVMHSA
jgi:hypothetical protein